MLPAHDTLGSLLRARRAERGLTLQKVAEAAGCDPSYLSLLERDLRDAPSADLLSRLEAALGFERGVLLAAARWQSTPDEVRREVAHLQGAQRIARRLADILCGSTLDEHGRLLGSLDAAYRSGELRRLVEAVGGEAVTDDTNGMAPSSRANAATSPAQGGGGGAARLSLALPSRVPLINKVAAGYPADFTDLGYPARVADEYVRAPALDTPDPDAFAARVVGDSMLPEYREGDVVVFSPARPVKSGMDCFARLEPDHQSTFKRIFFEDDAGARIRLQPLNLAYPARVLPREEVAGLYAAVSVTRAL